MHNSTHLILVSDQTIPNISPILDQRFRPKKVVLMFAPDKQEVCHRLQGLYRTYGVETLLWPINNAWDIYSIQDRVLELLVTHEHDEIILNTTGGSKPMSIAAYEVFRSNNKKIFYVHPEKDLLIWMYPHDPTPIDLEDRIKIPNYLKAFGAEEVSYSPFGVKPELRQLNQALVTHIEQFSGALSILNYYASTAEHHQLTSEPIDHVSNKNHDFQKLLDLFKQAQLLNIKQNKLHFTDEAARFICNGGWLEYYTHSCCLNIKDKLILQDVKRNVVVKRRAGQETVKNELDVVLLKDNKAYIIECKTRMFKKRSPDMENTLYKLDSISDTLGGVQCRSMLVSYHPMHEHASQRAHELHIEYCSHSELKQLQQKLMEWIPASY